MATNPDSETGRTIEPNDPPLEQLENDGKDRRLFTRNALLGGAVLMSLANRSAWATVDDACVSDGFWHSFTNVQNGTAHSMHPNWQESAAKVDNNGGPESYERQADGGYCPK